MKLETVRTDLAAILTSAVDSGTSVIDAIPDSVAPPSVYITWADPWVTPGTFCDYAVNVNVIVVAQRIEPGGQYGILEGIISTIVPALRASKDFTVKDASSPYPITLGGVNYLAASVNLTCDIGE